MLGETPYSLCTSVAGESTSRVDASTRVIFSPSVSFIQRRKASLSSLCACFVCRSSSDSSWLVSLPASTIVLPVPWNHRSVWVSASS